MTITSQNVCTEPSLHHQILNHPNCLMIMYSVHVREEKGEVKGEYEGICKEEEVNVDYGGMVQPSQQHVTPCVKVVEWGLGTRGLRMVAAFSAGIPVKVTQEAGLVPRYRRTDNGTPF